MERHVNYLRMTRTHFLDWEKTISSRLASPVTPHSRTKSSHEKIQNRDIPHRYILRRPSRGRCRAIARQRSIVAAPNNQTHVMNTQRPIDPNRGTTKTVSRWNPLGWPRNVVVGRFLVSRSTPHGAANLEVCAR